jgi:hypothetical protein
MTHNAQAIVPLALLPSALKSLGGLKNAPKLLKSLNALIGGKGNPASLLSPEKAKQYQDAFKLIKAAEYLVCAYDDIRFYKDKLDVMGYKNCIMDFEVEAQTIRVENAVWAINGIVKPLMDNWGKIGSLIGIKGSGTPEEEKTAEDKFVELNKAVKELKEFQKEVKAEYNAAKRWEENVKYTQDQAEMDMILQFGNFKKI